MFLSRFRDWAGAYGVAGLFAAMLVVAPKSDGSEPASFAALSPPALPTVVSVDLWGIQIFSINEDEETFEIEATLEASWLDERLAFDAGTIGSEEIYYQGDGALDKLKSGMWWPYFEVTDARHSRDQMYVEVNIAAGGRVYYRERFTVQIKQGFDLSDFPFDSHSISFSIGPYGYDTERVVFEPMGDPKRVSNWEPEDWYVDWSELAISNEPDMFANATVALDIARDPRHYVVNIILPLLLIVVISSAVFWMNFDTTHLGDRLSVSFTSVLTVVAFAFVAADNLPRLGYSTVLDSILSWSYVFLALNILESLIASRLYAGRPAATRRLDSFFRFFYAPAYALVLWVLIAGAGGDVGHVSPG